MPVPINVQSATEDHSIRFHQYHLEDMGSLGQHPQREVAGILNASTAQLSVQQNSDMRRLSAMAALIAVPTMVAGVYGMNFAHMPELTWRYGYPAVLTVIAVVCTVIYRALRRNNGFDQQRPSGSPWSSSSCPGRSAPAGESAGRILSDRRTSG
jgi:Mg2+ and Co2+ transporter CorA